MVLTFSGSRHEYWPVQMLYVATYVEEVNLKAKCHTSEPEILESKSNTHFQKHKELNI